MTIEEAYKEWCGTDRLVNSNKEIHDSTECIEFAEYWHDKLVKTCDLADVGGSLPDADAITDASIEYAELPDNCELNDPRVREAAHFVAGATWFYKKVAKQ